MRHLYILILLGTFALSNGCTERSAQHAALPFEYTNIVHGVSPFNKEPARETIIRFTNGVWFGSSRDRATLGLNASDYETTIFFDPTNSVVTKIIQQTRIGTNRYWLIDRNGDGLPDQRKAFGDKEEDVLFQGEWMRSKGNAPKEIMLNGKWQPIEFKDGSWKP